MSNKPHISSIGPSSHRSPSSPLPADALEYFSETAARMGNSGASGMMIQSPDGRPAGIFFQPKPNSSLGTRTPGSGNGRRSSGDERFGSAVAANQNRMLNGIPNSSSSSSLNSSGKPSPNLAPHAAQRQRPSLTTKVSESMVPLRGEESKKPIASAISPSLKDEQPLSAVESEPGSTSSRQTFVPNAQPPTTSAKPSAQPQAGLLIGAGFTPTNKKGGGPKKVSANMEILPPIKVLIVEDNHINVKILSTFLKQRKIQFGVAKNGREAVDQWQTGGYHLILMDIQLPVMDGIEATKEIRRLERCANVGPINSTTPPVPANGGDKSRLLQAPAPTTGHGVGDDSLLSVSPSAMLNNLKASVIIVALTASILNSDRVAALAAGCNDFLNKPVNLRWLERKVIEWGSMQYLIGFRDINDDLRRQRKYQSLTDREVRRSNGLVEKGFGAGPDRLAREMAGRLHIGSRKAR